MTKADEIHSFWFGALARTREEMLAKVVRWYEGGPAVDAEIRVRFGDDVERALAGDYDVWAGTPRGRLALLLLVDQFTRSIFRGLPRAYVGDPKALALVDAAFASGADRALSEEERHFLFMPYLHAEDLAAQLRGRGYMERSFREASEMYAPLAAALREQSDKYTDLLRRFGRLPARNAVLRREPTAEESELLAEWRRAGSPQIMTELRGKWRS